MSTEERLQQYELEAEKRLKAMGMPDVIIEGIVRKGAVAMTMDRAFCKFSDLQQQKVIQHVERCIKSIADTFRIIPILAAITCNPIPYTVYIPYFDFEELSGWRPETEEEFLIRMTDHTKMVVLQADGYNTDSVTVMNGAGKVRINVETYAPVISDFIKFQTIVGFPVPQ